MGILTAMEQSIIYGRVAGEKMAEERMGRCDGLFNTLVRDYGTGE